MTEPDLLSHLPSTPAIGGTILIGLDDKSKHHASYFAADQIGTATAAASKMGMAVLPVDQPDVATLAASLPVGKIFESGKAFVPFVKRSLFDQLAVHFPDRPDFAGLRAAATASEAADNPAAKVHTLPKDWSVIAIGDLVLATEGGPEEGWYESEVLEVKGNQFTLRWRDWPNLPNFVRQREQLALLWCPPISKPAAN